MSEARSWDEIRAAAIAAVLATGRISLARATVIADAVLAVCDEEAVNRMAGTFVDETRIRAMDFRNGASMDLVPSQTLVAHWVAAAKTWLGDAPNYTETALEFGGKVSTEVKLAGEFERYVFILQRVGPGKLTPHQARKKAEAERDKALAELAALSAPIEVRRDA
jgi:hypothetical protein